MENIFLKEPIKQFFNKKTWILSDNPNNDTKFTLNSNTGVPLSSTNYPLGALTQLHRVCFWIPDTVNYPDIHDLIFFLDDYRSIVGALSDDNLERKGEMELQAPKIAFSGSHSNLRTWETKIAQKSRMNSSRVFMFHN